MQHLQPNFTLHGGKYRIEQKPRYLKVYLTNSADCNVIKIILAFLKLLTKCLTHCEYDKGYESLFVGEAKVVAIE